MNDRVYRIAPLYRRCCWYVLAATPVFFAALFWIVAPLQDLPLVRVAAAALWILTLALSVALPPLNWRLTIDDSGWRRRFLGVETLWPWSDFENGEIAAGGVCFRHRQRPWWNPWSSVCIGSLSEEDFVAVVETIDHFFPADSPPEPPDEILIRRFGERIRLDDKGVHVENRRGGASHSWSEVIAVDVMRDNSKSASFSMLEIVLPGRVVTLRNAHGKTAGFSNPPPPVVAEFLRRRVNDNRYAVSLGGEPSANRALVERRSREVGRDSTHLAWMTYGTVGLLLGFVLWDARVLVYLPLLFAFVWMARKHRAHAKAWRDLLEDDAWRTTPPPRLKL